MSNLQYINMDNFDVSVTGKGKELLRSVLAIAMIDYHHVLAYMEDDSPGNPGTRRLHLYWYYDENNNSIKLPYPFNIDQCIEFVWGWLQNADYGPEPDINGSCSKGWKIGGSKGGGWSHVIFTVEPVWAEHHK